MAEDDKKKPDVKDGQELLIPETPSEITSENAHLVDFENLKVRLICLITIPNAFAQVANFLKRRGWEVFVTTEIKDALTHISTYKPDFVLMSVNHSHKKINQFPQIVSQTFNVPVIAFGEKTDSKTMGAIQISRATYKIMGHLSGPTAQRKIKQILQDKYQVEEESKEGHRAFESIGAEEYESRMQKTEGRRNYGGALRFKNHKREQKGAIIFEKDQSTMKSAAESTGYNPFAFGGQQGSGITQKGPAYIPKTSEEDSKNQKSTAQDMQTKISSEMDRKKIEMAEALKDVSSGNKKPVPEFKLKPESQAEEQAKDENMSLEDLRAAALGLDEMSQKASFEDESMRDENNEMQDVSVVQEAMGEMTFQTQESGTLGSDPGSALQEGHGSGEHLSETEGGVTGASGKAEQEGYTMESEYIPKKEKEVATMESEYIGRSNDIRNHIKDLDRRSFIERATIEIVQKMRVEEHESSNELRIVDRVALLSVGHDDHKGYFMIAGHDIGMSLDDFVEEFTDHIKKHCVENKEIMEFGDYINMDCPSYDFFDNGEEGLEFNYVTNFGAGEVGIKFIHDEEAWAHVETKEEHEKSLIKAEQIVEDKPLEIDLFVHLQKNDKYYKIVSTDSELSKDRKDRLVENETEVFINNEDIGTYRSFQTKQKAIRAINGTVQRSTKKKAS